MDPQLLPEKACVLLLCSSALCAVSGIFRSHGLSRTYIGPIHCGCGTHKAGFRTEKPKGSSVRVLLITCQNLAEPPTDDRIPRHLRVVQPKQVAHLAS